MSIDQFLLSPSASVRDALRVINSSAKGIALLVDGEGRLTDTLTDGDIRRAILQGLDVEGSIEELLKTKVSHNPIVAPVGTRREEQAALMREHKVRQLPLLDDDGRPVGLETLDELLGRGEGRLQAVVMAGGFGKRLMPLTEDMPKPMLPVGDKPMLEHIIEQLAKAGIEDVSITTHYMPEKIMDHFQDGSKFGVRTRYYQEDEPLGTAGALSLMPSLDGPLIIINGDILTNVKFQAMHEYHRQHEADMTICVRKYELNVPYGVVEAEEASVTGIVEKPTLRFFVNAGIYLIDPNVQAMVPQGRKYDMPDLVHDLIAKGRKVASFPVHEYWLDIGQHADYAAAQQAAASGGLD